jgi:hypothetical protein
LGAPPLSREHSKRYPFRGDAFLMFKTMPDRVKTPSVGRGVAVSAGASLPPAPARFQIFPRRQYLRRRGKQAPMLPEAGDHRLWGQGPFAPAKRRQRRQCHDIDARASAERQGFGNAEAGALALRGRQRHVRLQRRRSPPWHPVEHGEPRRDHDPVGLVA